MSILIKGMKIPRRSFVDIRIFYDGEAVKIDNPYKKDYAVVEVPEPHGRLIDADELKTKHHWTDDYYGTEYVEVEDIDNAPTVIETEGEQC